MKCSGARPNDRGAFIAATSELCRDRVLNAMRRWLSGSRPSSAPAYRPDDAPGIHPHLNVNIVNQNGANWGDASTHSKDSAGEHRHLDISEHPTQEPVGSIPLPQAADASSSSSVTCPWGGDQDGPLVRGADASWANAVRGRNEPTRVIDIRELPQPWKLLGSGEFCSAYATTLDDRPVVVKLLKPEQRDNPTAAADLQSETYLMSSMRHPNILSAIAMGTHEGLPFLVVEMLSAILAHELPKSGDVVPFWTHRAQKKKWPLVRTLRTAKELAQALDYCHSRCFPGCRVLHRDLKPNNVGFMPDGRLCLFDFGLAKLWRVTDGDDGSECRPLTGNTGSLRCAK